MTNLEWVFIGLLCLLAGYLYGWSARESTTTHQAMTAAIRRDQAKEEYWLAQTRKITQQEDQNAKEIGNDKRSTTVH